MKEIFFYKGKVDTLSNLKVEHDVSKDKNQEDAAKEMYKKLQESFLKVLDNKNLSFLLGSGCSSFKLENEGFKEIGIPVMAPLAKEFYTLPAFEEHKNWLKTDLSIDVDHANFATNLETFLSTLHSLSFYHSKTK